MAQTFKLPEEYQGKAFSTCSGVRIPSVLSNYRDLNSGQAYALQPNWALPVRTPFTLSLDVRQPRIGHLSVGTVIPPGQEILNGVVNDSGLSIKITQPVEVKESLSTAQSQQVIVRGFTYHLERSPKLRSLAIKSSVCPDVTGRMQHVIKALLAINPRAEVMFPAEVIKGAVVSLKAFADTVLFERKQALVITDGTVPADIMEEHNQWVKANTHLLSVKHEIINNPIAIELYQKAGLEVREEGNKLFIHQDITCLFCHLVLEVEALPVQLRRAKGSLCANQVLTLSLAHLNKPDDLGINLDLYNTPSAIRTRRGLESFVEMLRLNSPD